jgi:hypothetical protein
MACEAGTGSRLRHTQALALASILQANAAGRSGQVPGCSVQASFCTPAILGLRDFPVYLCNFGLDIPGNGSKPTLLTLVRGSDQIPGVRHIISGRAQIPAKLT